MKNRPPIRACFVVVAIVMAAWSLRAAETTQAGPGRNEEIAMTVGKSVILDHPDEIARISIANPDIADAVAVSTKEVLVNAKAPGVTTMVIWSKSGERNFFTLNVGANIQQVQNQIRTTFPGEDIQLNVTANAVSLTGRASSAAVAEKAMAMVTGLGKTVVNNL